MSKKDNFFNGLHVLEIATNHWGDLARGIAIVDAYATLANRYGIKAAIKLQLRDVKSFIHNDFKALGGDACITDLKGTTRYVQKTQRTELSASDLTQLVAHIRKCGLIAMATVFDEASIVTAQELDLPALKIASADLSDLNLLAAAAQTGLPIAISSGGGSEDDVAAAMELLTSSGRPLALNHCVSRYPSERFELQLNQLDILRDKYPEVTLGFSSHEHQDPTASTLMSYAKGARTWERHVDIPYPEGHQQSHVSPYCLTPDKAEAWFAAFNLAEEMSGGDQNDWREISQKETDYLHALRRGVYFRRDIAAGESIELRDVYFAVPWQKGAHLPSALFVNGKFTAARFCEAGSAMSEHDVNTANLSTALPIKATA